MEKMFFFILILLAGNFSLVAKNYSEKEIRVSGFDSNKPLKKLTNILVSFPESPDDWYVIDAYKGETKNSFLKRIITPVNSTETKKNQVYRTSVPSIRNLDKEEIGFMDNITDGYCPIYRRPPGLIEKRRYLSLEEFQDSIMMEKNEFTENKSLPISFAAQEQKKFEESYLILVTFFVGLILFFILFGRIPLIWSTKNKK